MIKHCKEQEAQHRCVRPDVIQFETCGVCDENEGYFLVMKQWMNTIMCRRKALASSPRLETWLSESYCDVCLKREKFPLVLVNDDTMYCKACLPPGKRTDKIQSIIYDK